MIKIVTADLLNATCLHFRAIKYQARNERQISNIHSLVKPMNQWFKVYEINTPLRIAHFLAQACCETFDFSDMTERPAKGGKEYDFGTRVGKVLGNTHPGDGPNYIGRGLLHLTGRYNYRKIGKEIGVDIESKPKLVALDLDIAVRTAYVFWKNNGLNKDADDDLFMKISHKVNGYENGIAARKAALNRAKKFLNIP
ncbi:glycoside hydrolase family 19 protein [Rosenbergiella metrosideri]|uniref:glycoside hydrolase family 19 protein n=1 Tax=Rosenbergiella metrosideri TaxID=2921185 RepID=UPI001F4FBE16